MFAAVDYTGIGVLVTGVAALIAAIASAVAAHRAGAVRHEVKTMNELTIGQLGAAEETRRITDIDPAKRTAQEDRHMHDSCPHPRGDIP